MPFRKKHPELPPPTPGFEHISRYWDTAHELPAAKILPGEYYVTVRNELITTVLGSCVSACVRDRVFGIGGMNHFMLPVGAEDKVVAGADVLSNATRFGNYAMEHMINEILKLGGRKENLEVKVFGGGRMIEKMTRIGDRNIEFVHEYIRAEGLNLLAEDIGDISPGKVVFIPATGVARVKKLKHLHNETIVQREQEYKSRIEQAPVQGSVELF